MVVSENILGAFSLVHHGQYVCLEEIHQKKTLSFEGNILLQISYFEKQFVNKRP
jgi:hypothetical protein